MANCSSDIKIIEVKSDQKVVSKLCEQLLAQLKQKGFTKDDIFASHLALEEALVNAVRHGNKNDPNKKVIVKYKITDDLFDISVTDQGTGFKPAHLPDPRCNGNIYKPGGRGVLLMRAYMDTVEYNNSGNTVHMTRRKKRSNVKS